MRLRVLAFASASDALGASETELEVDDGLDVAALRAALAERYPALRPLWPRLAIGVDGTIVHDETVALRDGAEVALLPPVSGG